MAIFTRTINAYVKYHEAIHTGALLVAQAQADYMGLDATAQSVEFDMAGKVFNTTLVGADRTYRLPISTGMLVSPPAYLNVQWPIEAIEDEDDDDGLGEAPGSDDTL